MPTSSKPATSPHQADRSNTETNPSRLVARSGVDEPTVPAFVTTAVRLIISVHRGAGEPPRAERRDFTGFVCRIRYSGPCRR